MRSFYSQRNHILGARIVFLDRRVPIKPTLWATFPLRSLWPLAHVVRPPPRLSSGTFSRPRKEMLSHRAVGAPFRPSPALAAASPLPVPVALPLLEAPQKRNHTLCGLLSLASVTGPSVARHVRAAAHVRPSSFSRLGDTPPRFVCAWAAGRFPVLATVNHAGVPRGVRVCSGAPFSRAPNRGSFSRFGDMCCNVGTAGMQREHQDLEGPGHAGEPTASWASGQPSSPELARRRALQSSSLLLSGFLFVCRGTCRPRTSRKCLG